MSLIHAHEDDPVWKNSSALDPSPLQRKTVASSTLLPPRIVMVSLIPQKFASAYINHFANDTAMIGLVSKTAPAVTSLNCNLFCALRSADRFHGDRKLIDPLDHKRLHHQSGPHHLR